MSQCAKCKHKVIAEEYRKIGDRVICLHVIQCVNKAKWGSENIPHKKLSDEDEPCDYFANPEVVIVETRGRKEWNRY